MINGKSGCSCQNVGVGLFFVPPIRCHSHNFPTVWVLYTVMCTVDRSTYCKSNLLIESHTGTSRHNRCNIYYSLQFNVHFNISWEVREAFGRQSYGSNLRCAPVDKKQWVSTRLKGQIMSINHRFLSIVWNTKLIILGMVGVKKKLWRQTSRYFLNHILVFVWTWQYDWRGTPPCVRLRARCTVTPEKADCYCWWELLHKATRQHRASQLLVNFGASM